MWNYNLDEMPKDGTKIVGFFKHDDYKSTSVFHYDSGDWRRESHVLPVSTRYLECWTYAPKEPKALLIDWFDHVYPEAASANGAEYFDGLEAIKKRIEFKLSQHDRKQPEMAESAMKVAEKMCPFHKIKLQDSYCIECQGWIIG